MAGIVRITTLDLRDVTDDVAIRRRLSSTHRAGNISLLQLRDITVMQHIFFRRKIRHIFQKFSVSLAFVHSKRIKLHILSAGFLLCLYFFNPVLQR